MEVSKDEILKIIEEASGLRDILSKKDAIQNMIDQLKSLKDVTEHFKSIDELTTQVKDVEKKIFILKEFLTSTEAAKYLSVTRHTIREAVKRGELNYYHAPCKGYHFTKDDLNSWLSRYRVNEKEALSLNARAEVAAMNKRKRNGKKS